jgi:hypothetical protein
LNFEKFVKKRGGVGRILFFHDHPPTRPHPWVTSRTLWLSNRFGFIEEMEFEF